MNRQFVISVVAMFVVLMLLGFSVHGFWLAGDYAALTGMYRGAEDGQAYFHWMIIAHVVMAVGLTWIYRQGCNDSAWLGQGLRFGLAVAVLASIPHFLIYYAVQPTPGMLVVKQIIGDTISMLLAGVAVAALNRPRAAA